MIITPQFLDGLRRAARELGEDEVTIRVAGRIITFRFAPRDPSAACIPLDYESQPTRDQLDMLLADTLPTPR